MCQDCSKFCNNHSVVDKKEFLKGSMITHPPLWSNKEKWNPWKYPFHPLVFKWFWRRVTIQNYRTFVTCLYMPYKITSHLKRLKTTFTNINDVILSNAFTYICKLPVWPTNFEYLLHWISLVLSWIVVIRVFNSFFTQMIWNICCIQNVWFLRGRSSHVFVNRWIDQRILSICHI